MEIRLQKLIAGTGLASRRKAERMIAEGLVTVNGKVVRELGTKVDPSRDHVKVNGRHLRAVQPYVYLMLNKPKGVVSTLEDPEGRPTVKDLLRGVSVRVFPVGRLDCDSEGLMLLTNHGELAQALLHPRYHVPKTYLIKVKGVLTREDMDRLARGVTLEGRADRAGDGQAGPEGGAKFLAGNHDSRRPEASGETHVGGGRAPGAQTRAGPVRSLVAGRSRTG
ncbi:MAG: hypothetical protein KatS3mg082_2146 [Nitrospiraceae bacterium]|nr:MAG: hypothetical protein KatS3mg082_2146 [Nitrospiraceae bacterium]